MSAQLICRLATTVRLTRPLAAAHLIGHHVMTSTAVALLILSGTARAQDGETPAHGAGVIVIEPECLAVTSDRPGRAFAFSGL
ncbi:hypothetical protein [Gemmobacter serpentinus]|uniref:hypothetical protein n=1 Tax=Gemmobacter serpentinus TaxID=2652247 RepID=UPI00124E89BD|nr:hypothetical protein [Gemmobacter serpentinus]